MSLFLKSSNSLANLALQMCSDLTSRKVPVFQPHYLVTQTEGMNSWLKLQMASNLGIAANYRFLKPNELVQLVYNIMGGPYLDALSADSQSWLLFKILNEKEFKTKFKFIADYYAEGRAGQDIKRMALAEKLADLFDQYQIYRPEMIRKWNNAHSGEVNNQEWQKFLWIKAKQLSDERLPDKTLTGDFIIKALADSEKRNSLRLKMPAIYIFGLSVTTGYHIQLIHHIGRVIDIHFYLLNPAPSVYWFDDRSEKQLATLKSRGLIAASENVSGNVLLSNWGRVIQNTFGLLFQDDELLNAYEETGIEEPAADTLLHKIQQDIFYNSDSAGRNKLSLNDLEDGSVTINACYTPAREVEVLYNFLINLIDRRKERLSPGDIVVMVSDIDAYAPFIKAVFDHAPYTFAYTIADESYASGDSLIAALQLVLGITEQTFTAENVIQILDSAHIRSRFGISDVDFLRKVTDRANIRFGIHGNLTDESVFISWKYGIERIMYGICMSGEEEYFTDDYSLFPLDMVEGSASTEVIRFVHFATVLMDSLQQRQHARTLSDWVLHVEKVLSNLVIEPGDDQDDDYDLLASELEKYNLLHNVLTDLISYEVFSGHFLQSIGQSSRSGSFAAGGITFCSLIPMRSIPFKVVATLGLNFDKFPRKEYPASFNLMEKEKRKGDRNVRENDKHLFLETLLSARDYLYISFIGMSSKDNSTIPPSALVDELINYVTSGLETEEHRAEEIITRHPLHSFSRKYNADDSRLYHYSKNEKRELNILKSAAATPNTIHFSEISLSNLISFFKNPFKEYYRKVYEINYSEVDLLLSDYEKFELNKLELWNLKQSLLKSDLSELQGLRNKLVKTGVLPLKNMADVLMDELVAEVEPVKALFAAATNGATEQIIPLELSIDHITITGTLGGVYNGRLVILSWSKNETKYLLEAYIKYLVACASGLPLELIFISAIKGEAFSGTVMSKELALGRLEELLQLYSEGHRGILPFYPDFKINISRMEKYEKDFAAALKTTFEGEASCNDRYLLKEYQSGFFSGEDIAERFKQNIEIVLCPLAGLFPQYYQ